MKEKVQPTKKSAVCVYIEVSLRINIGVTTL